MATKKSKSSIKKAPLKKVAKKAAKKAAKVSKPIPNLKGEVWKKVVQSDRPYFVSNLGRIKSFYYDKVNGVILKGKIVNGYLALDIVKKDIRRLYYIHHLVASAFVKKTSPKQNTVIHINWKKLDNTAKNLGWTTQRESFMRTAKQNQKLIKTNKRPTSNSKLNRDQVIKIKKLLKGGARQIDVATKFKISEMQISRIARGESWGYVKI
jgi:hypothetical protein